MSKSNAWEEGLIRLVFNNTNFANVGDATGLRGSSTAGSLYVSLHTSDPGEGGSQNTNEISYTGYARLAVARDGTPWTVTGGAIENTNELAFPACSGGSPQNATHFGIGTASSGAGVLLYSGALSSTVSIGPGVTPRFPAGSLDGSED